jgi:hypothetical protein
LNPTNDLAVLDITEEAPPAFENALPNPPPYKTPPVLPDS